MPLIGRSRCTHSTLHPFPAAFFIVVVINANAFLIFDNGKLPFYLFRHPVIIAVKGHIPILIHSAFMFLIGRFDIVVELHQIRLLLFKQLQGNEPCFRERA